MSDSGLDGVLIPAESISEDGEVETPVVGKRFTQSPGPRTKVTLDVSEVGLAEMVKGLRPVRCWLTENADGSYSFNAVQTVGESRKQAGEASVDVLVELVNRLGKELEKDDVPERLWQIWRDLIAEYERRTAALTEPEPEASA